MKKTIVAIFKTAVTLLVIILFLAAAVESIGLILEGLM